MRRDTFRTAVLILALASVAACMALLLAGAIQDPGSIINTGL